MNPPTPLQVLHLEDDANDAALVQSTLKAGGFNCATTRVQNQEDFVAALERGDFDLILSDYTLPAFDGLSAMEIARAKCPDVPLIFVSGTLGEERSIVTLKSGATDYVLKDGLARLVPAVRRVLSEMEVLSEQRRLEGALRESEIKFRTLFDVAKDGISMFQNGLCVDCNDKALENYGVTRDQILGQSLAFFSPPTQPDGCNSVEKARRITQGAMEGEPQFFEWVHLRADGRQVYSDVSLCRFELHGEPYLQAVARDITERKRAEARLRRLVDSNAQGVIFWNRKGGVSGANNAFLRLVDQTREDLEAGRINWVQMTPPEYAHLDVRAMEEIAAQGTCIPYEKELLRKDGTRVPVLLGAAIFEDDPEEGVCFFVDLTESRRTTAQIAEQAAFLDKARDAIIVRDLEGKILFWNKGAERIYGWTREETVGRTVVEITHPDSKKFQEINGLVLSRGEFNGEIEHSTKDGRELTMEVRCTLIRDNGGRPKAVLAINTDVTEKKKIEAQFMRAQRMESIGTLAGGIAHDLNNILAPIMMSIDILKTISEHPQAMKILETIEVSAKRGADIVRQVLSFARGLEGERVEVQPKHLLRDLENIIKDTFPKDVRLEFFIPNDTWTILGDPTQVHQVLLNLCVNARDAMPNGGRLNVGVENCVIDEHYAAMNQQVKAGRYVNISVTDSGMGIPPNLIDKIFEPFFTTKELHKGTGLGLSTVMAIVKSHDGIINVYSEPRKGTTFKVYLPAMELSSEALKKQSQLLNIPRENGETILVVDDEASILTITGQTLQTFGYRILTATDGADALAVYVENKKEIAVVLTDMMMPVMDGPAMIHALRRINPAIKIIAASGLGANGGESNPSLVGVKHFLTKPYTAGTLLKVIRTILEAP